MRSGGRLICAVVVLTMASLLISVPVEAAVVVKPDSSFGGDGIALEKLSDRLSADVRGVAKAPDGDLVIALEPAHIVWGCCAAPVGAWSLARLQPDGTPDPTFGTGGIVPPALSATNGTAASLRPASLALDTSGRIVLVGGMPGADQRPGVMRRLANGTADTAFGSGGLARVGHPSVCADDQYVNDVVPQSGGALLLFGSCSSTATDTYFALVVTRLTAAGNLDTSFGAGGYRTVTFPKTVGACCGVEASPLGDGRVLVGMGSNKGVVVRLLANGAPDPSYGGSGNGVRILANGGGSPVVALPDGQAYVGAGSFGSVTHLTSAGAVDPTFDELAMPDHDPCGYPTLSGLAWTSSRLVGGISCLEGLWLSAVSGTGVPDAAFGIRASSARPSDADDILGSMSILDDGDGFFAVGTDPVRGTNVERRNADGSLDTDYGDGGVVHLDIPGTLFDLDVTHATPDSQGRVVVAALVDNRGIGDENAVVVARFLATGSLDPSFSGNGWALVEGGGQRARDGESLLDPRVVINADDSVTVVAQWRSFWNYAPVEDIGGIFVARLTPSGQPDTVTIPGGRRITEIPDLAEYSFAGAVHGSGSTILVGGARLRDDGYEPFVARFTAAGALDTSYGLSGYAVPASSDQGSEFTQLAALPGGGALLGWREYTDNFDRDDLVLAKLGANGSFDGSFATAGRFRDDYPNLGTVAVGATTTGKPLIAWVEQQEADLDHPDFTSHVHVLRLGTNGLPDPTFGSSGQLVLNDKVTNAPSFYSDRIETLGVDGERPLLLVTRVRNDVRSDLIRVRGDGTVDSGFPFVIGHSSSNVYGLRTVLLGSGDTITLARTEGAAFQAGIPQIAVRRWVAGVAGPNDVGKLSAPMRALTGKATFSWAGLGLTSPARVEQTSASAKGPFSAWTSSPPTSATKTTISVAAGQTVCLRVLDADGTRTRPTCSSAPLTAKSLTRKGSWTPVTAKAMYAGGGLTTSARRAKLVASSVKARTIALVVSKCPTCGSVNVLWNGTRVKTVSLKGKAAHRVVVPVKTFTSVRTGTVTIKVITRKKTVTVEGLSVWRDDPPA